MSKYGKIFKPLEKLLAEAGEEAGEKAAKEAAEKAAKEAAEKAAKEAAEKSAEEAAEKAAKEAAEEAAEKAAKEAGEEAAEKVSGRAAAEGILDEGSTLEKNVKSAIKGKEGGAAAAEADFARVTEGLDVKTAPNGSKVAQLPDGSHVTLRKSSDGRITVSIQEKGANPTKYRYNE